MNNLLIETMQSYNEYLGNIVLGSDTIISNIQNDEVSKALQLILQFSEGVTWLIEVNHKLKELGYENELNHESIQEFLNEINNGLEIQDFILVSDIFEYEIKPFFENCIQYKIPQEN
ncbi:hypothetical protein [Lysinibacillus sphaericus]|uniref:hypothetical protein n=1 Tax=Lysinibacillus sphaericus TaxID=1421 RepID=UPI00068CB451|nr:hypothetical protein [Lysinibacillus sphaericus]